MAKKKERPKLNVKQLKEIEPKLDVYEFSPYKKYVVVIKKSPLVGIDSNRAMLTAKEVARVMIAANIPCQMVVGVDDEVQFFELSEK